MSKRLGLTIILGIAGVSAALAACGDDPVAVSSTDGGAGGDGSSGAPVVQAGTSTGGSSNPAGGAGGEPAAGMAGAPDAAGAGGASAGAGGEMNGASGNDGMGGAGGDAGVTYACKATTIVHKLCSALVAASCPDETICSDCVTSRNSDRATFADCPACAAHFDAASQCAIDAYESGNLSAGVECFEGFGADINDACGAHFNDAVACQTYTLENPCPQSWPVN